MEELFSKLVDQADMCKISKEPNQPIWNLDIHLDGEFIPKCVVNGERCHGIYVYRDKSPMNFVFYVKNGFLKKYSIYPKSHNVKFTNKMINHENVYFHDQMSWYKNENEEVYKRVRDGLKPIGQLKFWADEDDQINAYMDKIKKDNLIFKEIYRFSSNMVYIRIAREGLLSEIFDFALLESDYKEYIKIMNLIYENPGNGFEVPTFDEIKDKKMSEVLDHVSLDNGFVKQHISNLLLGYPIHKFI